MDELLGKNLVMPKYMKDEDDETIADENIESILDFNEVLNEKFDEKSNVNIEEVDENGTQVKKDYSPDTKDKVEVIDINLDKIKVVDVEKCEENNVHMNLIKDENINDNLDEIEVEGGYYVKMEENESKVVDKNLDKIESVDKTGGGPVKVNDNQKLCSKVLGGGH